MISKIVGEYLSRTSLHGFSFLGSVKPAWKKIYWLLSISIALSLALREYSLVSSSKREGGAILPHPKRELAKDISLSENVKVGGFSLILAANLSAAAGMSEAVAVARQNKNCVKVFKQRNILHFLVSN